MNEQFIIAGFGGQGVLFVGKLLAYAGMNMGKEISWLPSYGPEMRGGTANCSVVISERPVGSPIVLKPTTLIAMNGPSLDKFIDDVQPGGKVFVDSTLVTQGITRTDVDFYPIPATQLAIDKGVKALANMILMGKVLREMDGIDREIIEKTLKKVVPAKKAEMLVQNMEAIEMGFNL